MEVLDVFREQGYGVNKTQNFVRLDDVTRLKILLDEIIITRKQRNIIVRYYKNETQIIIGTVELLVLGVDNDMITFQEYFLTNTKYETETKRNERRLQQPVKQSQMIFNTFWLYFNLNRYTDYKPLLSYFKENEFVLRREIKLPQIINILGIKRFSFYPNITGKRVLLLGEQHIIPGCPETKINVIPVSEYVQRAARQTPEGKCLDIFEEGSYKISTPFFVESGLEITRQMLFVLENTKQNKHLRVHHTDIRFPEIIPYPIIMRGPKWNEKSPSKYFLPVIDYLLNIDKRRNKKYFNHLVDALRKFEIIKVSKQEKDSWEKIYFDVMNKEFKKIDKKIITKKKLVTGLRQVYHNLMNEGKESFSGILKMLPMDIYNLTRLFINFNDKPGRSCNRLTIDNCIIHTGSAHTVVYEKFFELVFDQTPSLTRYDPSESSDLCLEIPGIDFWDL